MFSFSYEIINEPWAGNYFKNPKLLLPGVAGATNLQPFYDTMAKAIRSVDNDTLIFFEPVTWGGMAWHFVNSVRREIITSSIYV